MYRTNIISAGKMMAFVLMLFGVLHCGATFIPFVQEGLSELRQEFLSSVLFYSFASAAFLLACGILLATMLWKVELHPILSTPILIIGTFVGIYGILCVAFLYLNPFSWMMAILGLAVFIDTLCLKLSFGRNRNKVPEN